MEKPKSYRDLKVWQIGMDIATDCYHLIKKLPREERYIMGDQIWRAASSIPANIAEGFGRSSRGSYAQFLGIAQGSLKELDTHLILCERVSILSNSQTQAILENCDTVGRMLRSLIAKLKDA